MSKRKPPAPTPINLDKLLSKPETTAYADELVSCFHDHVRQMVAVTDSRLPNDALQLFASGLTVLVGLGIAKDELLRQTGRMFDSVQEARIAIASERAAA